MAKLVAGVGRYGTRRVLDLKEMNVRNNNRHVGVCRYDLPDVTTLY